MVWTLRKVRGEREGRRQEAKGKKEEGKERKEEGNDGTEVEFHFSSRQRLQSRMERERLFVQIITNTLLAGGKDVRIDLNGPHSARKENKRVDTTCTLNHDQSVFVVHTTNASCMGQY